MTPLPYMFQLLDAKNVHASVVNLIMEMVEHLLTADEEEELDEDGADIPQALDVGHLVENLNEEDGKNFCLFNLNLRNIQH